MKEGRQGRLRGGGNISADTCRIKGTCRGVKGKAFPAEGRVIAKAVGGREELGVCPYGRTRSGHGIIRRSKRNRSLHLVLFPQVGWEAMEEI